MHMANSNLVSNVCRMLTGFFYGGVIGCSVLEIWKDLYRPYGVGSMICFTWLQNH